MKFVTLTHIDGHPTRINVGEVFFVMHWDDDATMLLLGRNTLRPGRAFVKGTLQEVMRRLFGDGKPARCLRSLHG